MINRNRLIQLTTSMLILWALAAVAAAQGMSANRPDRSPGMVFTQTNDASDNEVVVFSRASDGTLTELDTVSTDGEGTGAGLGSQGAVVLSQGNRWLFAVNAGSNELSVFRVGPNGLSLTDVESTGGSTPISVTSFGKWVYVVNAGSDEITGFSLSNDGSLTPIANSTQSLSGVGVGAAQVEFSPNGKYLVVTEKATNMIGIFPVGLGGVAGTGTFYSSAGTTPFGFGFTQQGELIVSEAVGGAPGLGAMSSYRYKGSSLVTLDASEPTNQTAACWAIATQDGRYAYSSNTPSGTLTGFAIDRLGNLHRLDDDGVTANVGAGSAPLDMALSNSGRYLYTLASGSGEVVGYQIGNDGSLMHITSSGSLPSGTAGLAGF